MSDLPDRDLEHIAVDIQRPYDHLASEWLDYVEHLPDPLGGTVNLLLLPIDDATGPDAAYGRFEHLLAKRWYIE